MPAQTRVLRATVALAGVTFAAAPACSNVAPARPQLVIVVDTDAPVPDLVAENPELSGDAAVDTLRIDSIATDGSGQTYDLRDFLAPGPGDWPISFGVVRDDASPTVPVRFRLRAFRGYLATAGELNGIATLDPTPEVTIDRLIDVDLPADGIRRVRVTLRGDCLGVPSTFAPAVSTCIDGSSTSANPSDGVVDDGGEPSFVGTWAVAASVPCSGQAPAGAGAVCVAGGFSVLGDLAFEGFGDGFDTLDSTPLRPVRVSPFFMDRTEVTVGAVRALVNAKKLGASLPAARGNPLLTDGAYCTWLGAGDGADDALPVNCVTYATAEAICAALGGQLPSEAQWEHAARGRGQGRLYPWGAADPSCCIASTSRSGLLGIPTECPGKGVQAVGSHPDAVACGGLGDQSIDGILNLGGSLSEAMRDTFRPYGASCWQGGILIDPVCTDETDGNEHSSRGGYWNSGLSTTAAPFRYSFAAKSSGSGLRCVYPGGGL